MTKVDDLVRRLIHTFPAQRIVLELERLKVDGIIATSTEEIGPDTEVRLVVPSEPKKDAS